MVAMTFGTIHNTNAQDNQDRDGRRQEMQARMTERLISDLKLTDEQKVKFEPVYQNYLKELSSLRTQRNQADDDQQRSKKDLTDAEATSQLNDIFTRQAEQIQQQQLRLDIQRKYCAELSSFLTPQQLLRVFQPQQQNRQRQGGQQNRRGGFDGGPRGGGFGGGGFGGPGGGFGGPGGGF